MSVTTVACWVLKGVWFQSWWAPQCGRFHTSTELCHGSPTGSPAVLDCRLVFTQVNTGAQGLFWFSPNQTVQVWIRPQILFRKRLVIVCSALRDSLRDVHHWRDLSLSHDDIVLMLVNKRGVFSGFPPLFQWYPTILEFRAGAAGCMSTQSGASGTVLPCRPGWRREGEASDHIHKLEKSSV